MKNYTVKTKWFKCSFSVKDGKVINTDPILRRFEGQAAENLFNWLDEKDEDYHVEEIK